jgi:alpha-1,3-glucan synthase
VGPVIDLYGRFAAEKLARLMELYPERVYSRPEFTALPPYLFSGADFALIPSRDEPFGLVAVEFGRKGALGVGSRLGGLGLMPGWVRHIFVRKSPLTPLQWFPVESNSTTHMLSQLTKTIKLALASTKEERAILRARSAVQRFPVVEWRQKMEDFHKRSIVTSRHLAGDDAWRESDCSIPIRRPDLEGEDWTPEMQPDPSRPEWANGSPGSSRSSTFRDSLHTPSLRHMALCSSDTSPLSESRTLSPSLTPGRSSISTDISEGSAIVNPAKTLLTPPDLEPGEPYGEFLASVNRQIAREHKHLGDPFLDIHAKRPFGTHSRGPSSESISSIVDEKTDSPLNKAMTSVSSKLFIGLKSNNVIQFTDQDGDIARAFIAKLQLLSAENSKSELSIERYLVKSEEAFFDRVKKEKISSAASILSSRRDSSTWNFAQSLHSESRPPCTCILMDYFSRLKYSVAPFGHTMRTSLSKGPSPSPHPAIMTAMQIRLAREIKGWPLYTIILALGQMLGATSFQITLLSGQNYQGDIQLYVLGCVFFVASLVWYALFRYKPSVYVLAYPWIFFGLAFFLVGLPSISDVFSATAHDMITSVATWCYAIASAAAFLFFGLNFGEEAVRFFII